MSHRFMRESGIYQGKRQIRTRYKENPSLSMPLHMEPTDLYFDNTNLSDNVKQKKPLNGIKNDDVTHKVSH